MDPNKDESARVAKKVLNAARLRACMFLKDKFQIREIYPEYTQIVKWPAGSYQVPHRDNTRTSTSYAAIIYLNDDFEGGATFFPTARKVAVPQQGKLIGFEGRNIVHGVAEILEGTRYTLPCWFTADARFAEL